MAAAGVIVGEERYVFETQWYDQQAELNRYYRITFYPGDSTIEMVRTLFPMRDAWVVHICLCVIVVMK